MATKFKIITSDNKRGVEIEERDFQNLIRICYNRSNGLFIKLFSDYEYLLDRKVKYSEIGIKLIK